MKDFLGLLLDISELIGGWWGFAFFSFGSVGALMFRLLSDDNPTGDSDTNQNP